MLPCHLFKSGGSQTGGKMKKFVKSYKKYIESPVWQATRKRFHQSFYCKRKCYICGAGECPLDLHHKTYLRLGQELLSDLIELCPVCHSYLHRALRESTIPEITLWNAADKIKLLIPILVLKKGQKAVKLNKKRKKKRKKKKKQYKISNKRAKYTSSYLPKFVPKVILVKKGAGRP